MLPASFSISPHDLWNAIATPDAPVIVDVRRREIFEASAQVIPGAVWRSPDECLQWAEELQATRPIVIACKAGHELSQMAAAQLRASGHDARVLAGGYAGWCPGGCARAAACGGSWRCARPCRGLWPPRCRW